MMGKIWNLFERNDAEFFFWVIFGLLLVLNLSFWFTNVNVPNNSVHEGDFTVMCNGNLTASSTCQLVRFDAHGFTFWEFLVIFILILELIFICVIMSKKKLSWESYMWYTFKAKGIALGYTLLIYITVVPFIWLIFWTINALYLNPNALDILAKTGIAIMVKKK
jgi:hypothetical protein